MPNTSRVINFNVILKIVPKGFLPIFFIIIPMNYGTSHINTILDGFDIRSTVFFYKYRVTGLA